MVKKKTTVYIKNGIKAYIEKNTDGINNIKLVFIGSTKRSADFYNSFKGTVSDIVIKKDILKNVYLGRSRK